MTKKDIIIIVDYSNNQRLTKYDMCELCEISEDFLQELMLHAILPPDDFELTHVERVKKVIRLQQDLEVNLAGSAVILDLLDQIEEMEKQLRIMRHHISK